jgi:hypothetical protein
LANQFHYDLHIFIFFIYTFPQIMSVLPLQPNPFLILRHPSLSIKLDVIHGYAPYFVAHMVHNASFDFLKLREIRREALIREVAGMREGMTPGALTKQNRLFPWLHIWAELLAP